jgi:hypothetical protein
MLIRSLPRVGWYSAICRKCRKAGSIYPEPLRAAGSHSGYCEGRSLRYVLGLQRLAVLARQDRGEMETCHCSKSPMGKTGYPSNGLYTRVT